MSNNQNITKERRIVRLLMQLGGSPKHKGFHYLKTGLRFCTSDSKSLTNLSKLLYPRIAEEYETTSISVERAARAAIQSGWHRRDRTLADEIFGNSLQSENDVPSNALYMAAVTEWIRDEEE